MHNPLTTAAFRSCIMSDGHHESWGTIVTRRVHKSDRVNLENKAPAEGPGTWSAIFSGAWKAARKRETARKAWYLQLLSSRFRWFHPKESSSCGPQRTKQCSNRM